jgi:hypothetical protein
MSQREIDALLTERAGYVLRKLPARVAAVDAALAALGHRAKPNVETATADPESERATTAKRTRRTAD